MRTKISNCNISKSTFLDYFNDIDISEESLIKNTIFLLQNNIKNYSQNGYISIEKEDINLTLENSKQLIIPLIEASTMYDGIDT